MSFAIVLDHTAAIPLHRQLYEELRCSILSGRLVPGQRIPSTRALAQCLGISRATVTLSYEQLLSEGYLQTVPNSGTLVSHQIPDDLLRATNDHPTQPATQSSIQLSAYGANLAETKPPSSLRPTAPINFTCYGQPAFDEFPIRTWRRLLSRSCRFSFDMLDYPTDPLGYKPLREAIARYLTQSRAVKCEADQVVIVSGSQQALDLIARLLLDRGDSVAIEDPGYLDARHTFQAQGANLVSVPIDESGMIVEHLSTNTATRIKLVYVTPSHQFPTGAVLSLPRRLALLAWAQQTGAIIIEDDYDSEYRYGERPIPALQGLTASSSVIYISTFSKVLFPSLRIGYSVVPRSLLSVFTRAKWLADRQSPLLEQHALTDFINEGHLESHTRRMRVLYDQRRQALVQALEQYLGQNVTILGENAGMHLMVQFHTSLSDKEIVFRAAQMDVGLVSASPYYLNPGKIGEFILGYTGLSQEKIQEGVRRLAQVLLK
jgi:GntR family transcriptional regulator/MocR family aminotransferase